jgi:cytochrome c oxidase subunit 1
MDSVKTNYLNARTTVWSWVATTDHKRIAVMFFVATTAAMALGGLLALLLRLEHLTPGPTVVAAMTYNRAFTLHGVVMVFLFMIPAIPAVFGNFLLPLMIGAKDVAFPRLNLLSFYLYLAYSTRSPTAVVAAVFGVFVIGWSSIVTGLNFIVTTHTLRARGVTWMRLPLFVWSIYATSIIQVIATPVLGMTFLLLAADRLLGWTLFDPANGGDPVLFEHLFWFYSHPAVYIMVLPAMGVVTEVVSTFARKQPASYKAVAYSSLGIAFVGFLTWGHHLFVAGISTFDAGAFGVLSMLVAIFSAIKVYAWLATLHRGSIETRTPLLYVFAFFLLFVFGGMTGVAVASTSLDVHWHDTYFVVAHFHFIMVGSTLTGWLAALYYWFPKITGKTYSERGGALGAVLVLAGFVATFVPQFLLGNAGMPRRYYSYPARFQALNVVSTVGSWVLAAGLLVALGVLLAALVWGDAAGDNPWGSRSFEWRAPSPPPEENWPAPPDLSQGPYDYARHDRE